LPHHGSAGVSTSSNDAEDEIEAHYHAVAARDFDLATSTAKYYGTDLRILAYRLSVSGDYEGAAKVYRYVTENYDPTDAYSWEYYAYNLARSPNGALSKDAVLQAYEKAVELAKDNPLYRGRLLGYRAELGEPVDGIVSEACKLIAFYQMTVGSSAVTYFAEPVLNGLGRAKRPAAARSILKKFPFVQRNKSFEW